MKPDHTPKNRLQIWFLMSLIAFSGVSQAEQIFFVNHLDLGFVEQDWGRVRTNRSVGNRKMHVAGVAYTNGFGTHAYSRLMIKLDGSGKSFSASVGVDDLIEKGHGSVIFKLNGDGKILWQSPIMRSGDAARDIKIDLVGIEYLTLIADCTNDGTDDDHADWLNGKIVMREGQPVAVPASHEPAVILTPKPSPKPRINSAKVFGVRPGSPFLFTVAATGDRPMTFSASGLPAGLEMNPTSGRITGRLDSAGEYFVTLRARNARGDSEQRFKILCGEKIGLTPAMGWNSWNCFGPSVAAEDIKRAADAMAKSGLINHGWTYINIDDFWEANPHRTNDLTLQGEQRDERGRILPNKRFPNMKGLADYVHELGLKIGIYSSPGPWTCGGCTGSYDHEYLDAQSYADWGIDYLKYDWCSYSGIVTNEVRPNFSLPNLKRPYQVMRDALNQAPRDILYSLCQYGMGDVWEWGEEVGGNSWRTTGDIRDTWASMSTIGFGEAGHELYAGPGHFNDPDMLVVGMVGWGNQLRPTRLSPNEQYTHISLWCLLSSPLLIGCDMTQLDDFTLSLLTNDEVLEVNQDPLGRQASRVFKSALAEVWAKDMEDGSIAVGLFNRGQTDARIAARWEDLNISGTQRVRDLWRQKNLGKYKGKFDAKVPAHGVVMVRIWPVK